MPSDSVLTICVLLIGALMLWLFTFTYARAAEEKGLIPILEKRCQLRTRSAFALMIRGGPLYRISLYDHFMVIGMIGIFGSLGQYVVPYKQILEVKLQRSLWPLSGGFQIKWQNGRTPSFLWVLLPHPERIIAILADKRLD